MSDRIELAAILEIVKKQSFQILCMNEIVIAADWVLRRPYEPDALKALDDALNNWARTTHAKSDCRPH